MNKLSLNIDEIAVETFEMDVAGEPRGTVEAREAMVTHRTNPCGGTCFESCWTDC